MSTSIEQKISAPQRAILMSTKSLNLFLGGVGSGKTFLGGIISYRYVTQFPAARGFIGANTYLQLTQSTLFRIREYWKSIGVTEFEKSSNPNGLYVVNKKPPLHFDTSTHNFDDYYGIISFVNGAIIFTGSLDHAEAHYGKELAWAILDETKDSDETDVKEVILSRLRQRGIYLKDGKLANDGENFNPAYFLTSPAKAEWLNKLFNLDEYIDEITGSIYSATTFFKKEIGNRFVVISSTYHNQHNLPSNYIDGMKESNTDERAKAMIYANPFATVGSEFYSSFSRIKHVGQVKYDPEKPLHISFDQNTVPYNSASIWQFEQKGTIWICNCIDEIALENPRNSTEEVCEEFMERYPAHNAGLYFYGDASGRARSTLSKDFKHHYQIVEYRLRKYLAAGSNRTAIRNPPVIRRRDFINKIFEEKLPLRIVFDEHCKYMIADMLYCRQAPDGTKDKKIVEDKITKERYQKYGHLSDCFIGDTLITTEYGEKPIKDIEIGDKVLTRNGFRRVTAKMNKGIQRVNSYRIGDRIITCTPDHKIYADGHFIEARHLIGLNTIYIFATKRICKERLNILTDTHFTGIQRLRDHQTDITLKAGLKSMESGRRYRFTGIFGRCIMERYQKDIVSIISMAISAITESRTSLLSLIKNTYRIITTIIPKSIKINSRTYFLLRQSPKQLIGISLMPVMSGIKSTSTILYSQMNIRQFVSDAELSLQPICTERPSGVQENVNSNISKEDIESRINTKETRRANIAAKPLKFIDGHQIDIARVNVAETGESCIAEVFDISVEHDHEFFANGILVHNCMEYLLTQAFSVYFNI